MKKNQKNQKNQIEDKEVKEAKEFINFLKKEARKRYLVATIDWDKVRDLF